MITPKEKAEELINGFLYLQDDNFGIDYAKLCALKCVDEILKLHKKVALNTLKFYLEVKIEL